MSARGLSRRRLAVALVAALALDGTSRAPARAVRPAGGDYLVVTHCEDDGSGSLREAMTFARESDIVDLRGLTCSTITLNSGVITTTGYDIAVLGPGAGRLTIEGTGAAPVFDDQGGRIEFYDLTIANGHSAGSADLAGCVSSIGELSLTRTVISGCSHEGTVPGMTAHGGAVLADTLHLRDSTIRNSTVGSTTDAAYGGGAFVRHAADTHNSTISGNSATGYRANTGGIAIGGNARLIGTTISDNTAAFNAGVALFGYNASEQLLLRQSTISGNHASAGIGGVGTRYDTFIGYSTIAFNTEGGGYSGGLFASAGVPITLHASLVADNDSGGTRNDIDAETGARFYGDHSLVTAATVALPYDTIFAEPGLLPLADNGGAVKTHALPLTSRAVNGGGNVNPDQFYDQRGAGFRRTVAGAIDIGAYEVQSSGVVRTVGNCNDSGAGSLRATIAAATSGDAIDLSQLACSTISLESGALAFDGNLTLLGPGAGALRIDGGGTDRVFYHSGGLLDARGVTIAGGACSEADGCYAGGCIFSGAAVSLTDSIVRDCSAVIDGNGQFGGALYANRVVLERSTISNNTIAGSGNAAYGAGIWATLAIVRDSTVENNRITADTQTRARFGGGIASRYVLDIERSTVANNIADYGGGVGFVNDVFGGVPLRIVDSTISGNAGGGVLVHGTSAIANSTIANNTGAVAPVVDAGLYIDDIARIESTIVFGNTTSGGVLDIGTGGSGHVVGANDLVGIANLDLPRGTLDADPLLGPLADNGGPTKTHALQLGSPAIDEGNDIAGLSSDQRGAGFLRVFGVTADIGAFEVQTNEMIFRSGFDAGGH